MKYFGIAISVIIVGVIGFATVKKLSPVGWGIWGTTNTSSGIALHGYDPVAYFEDEAPVRGQESLYVFADRNVRDEWVAELRDGSLERSRENRAKR